MGKSIFLFLGILTVITSCSDNNDEIYFTIEDIKGRWRQTEPLPEDADGYCDEYYIDIEFTDDTLSRIIGCDGDETLFSYSYEFDEGVITYVYLFPNKMTILSLTDTLLKVNNLIVELDNSQNITYFRKE